jgi:hypothetical protein
MSQGTPKGYTLYRQTSRVFRVIGYTLTSDPNTNSPFRNKSGGRSVHLIDAVDRLLAFFDGRRAEIKPACVYEYL